jgi:ketosteroid isomerase-like protein
MSQENVELVRRGYELYAAGDLDAVAELFADDAKLPGGGGLGVVGTAAGTHYGPEGFLRGVEDALESFEEYRVEPEDFIDAGEAVVVPVRISGRGRTSRAMMETRLAHLWVLENGKVIRSEIYRTVPEALICYSDSLAASRACSRDSNPTTRVIFPARSR